VKIEVRTPPLCTGCRRLFIDFSKIGAGTSYAHGHAYYRLASANFTYTVDPIAHSPNTKNFTNDKLLAPSGSLQEKVLDGAYFDVDVADATAFPSAQLNAIGYAAGFDSGQFCPSSDPDALYGGCIDSVSLSATTVPVQPS
jgi:hypothetical protein